MFVTFGCAGEQRERIDLIDIACRIDRGRNRTARAVFQFLPFLSVDILPLPGAAFSLLLSLPLVALEKLRVRVTRLRRVTRRWPDTGKGIPGDWSRRRLSDVLSFVGVCVTGALYSTAIEPPRGPLSLSRRSPPLPRARAISYCAQGEAELSLSFSSSLPFVLPSRAQFPRVLVPRLATSKPPQSPSQ